MANANRITRLLLGIYPESKLALHFSSPLELLVAVILSAQCTDVRVNDVTRNLFRKYRHARDYADADPTVFEEEIRPTGFYKNKAKLVLNCCRKLLEDREGGAQAVRTVAAVSSSKSGRAEAYIGAECMRRRTHASKPFSRIQAGRTSL